jgi:hypothetical protein
MHSLARTAVALGLGRHHDRRLRRAAHGGDSRQPSNHRRRTAVDGTPLQTTLIAAHFPDVEAVKRGEGTIRIDVDVVVPLLTAGRHQLFFRNANDPVSAVYLANALMPKNDRISIARQMRDAVQRELRIEFDVRGRQTLSAGE